MKFLIMLVTATSALYAQQLTQFKVTIENASKIEANCAVYHYLMIDGGIDLAQTNLNLAKSESKKVAITSISTVPDHKQCSGSRAVAHCLQQPFIDNLCIPGWNDENNIVFSCNENGQNCALNWK